MKSNIELGINLKYTDKTGTTYFCEGDKVICYVGEKKYCGKIDTIGNYQENPDSELQLAICIDTSKSKMSYSSEIIKVKDITYICKSPFSDDEKPFNDEQNFIDMFIQRGCSREWAKVVYDRWNDAVVFYNIPIVKATAYAMQAIECLNKKSEKNNGNKKDTLAKLAKECSDMAVNEYFKMLDMYMMAVKQDNKDAYLCMEDTMDIVSKCWNDLTKQSVN